MIRMIQWMCNASFKNRLSADDLKGRFWTGVGDVCRTGYFDGLATLKE